MSTLQAPSLAPPACPWATAFRLALLAFSSMEARLQGHWCAGPGGHVHLSLSVLVTGSVNPSPFMVFTRSSLGSQDGPFSLMHLAR